MKYLILSLICATALAAAQTPFTMPTDYRCDLVAMGKGQEAKGIMQVSKDAQRMEMSAQGQNMVMIIRHDQKQVHMLMVDMKMVMTMPMGQGPAQQMKDPTRDPEAQWSKVGSEEVNGVKADKYEYTSKGNKGFVWVDPAKQVMVRVRDADGKSGMDFSNYQIGKQPATAFEVPKDYKPMGGMGGMSGAGE